MGDRMKIGDLVKVTGSYKEGNIGKLAIVLKRRGSGLVGDEQVFISIPATGECLWCFTSWVSVWNEVYHDRW